MLSVKFPHDLHGWPDGPTTLEVVVGQFGWSQRVEKVHFRLFPLALLKKEAKKTMARRRLLIWTILLNCGQVEGRSGEDCVEKRERAKSRPNARR